MEESARQAALSDLYSQPGHLLWRSAARVDAEIARLLPGRADRLQRRQHRGVPRVRVAPELARGEIRGAQERGPQQIARVVQEAVHAVPEFIGRGLHG